MSDCELVKKFHQFLLFYKNRDYKRDTLFSKEVILLISDNHRGVLALAL
jgi:hypothetical protein